MKPGIIYKAENKKDGKIYIGKTTQEFTKRQIRHKSDALQNRYKMYFHNAIREHGFENFEWSIIDTAENEKDLNDKEIYWIAEYKKTHTLYNMTDGGEGMCGWKPSEETRKKMADNNRKRIITEETRRKISAINKGKIVSEETKRKQSQNHADFNGKNNPMYGKPKSPETIKKLSEAHKGKKRPPEVIEKMRQANIGRKWTDETREKILKSRAETFKKKKELIDVSNL